MAEGESPARPWHLTRWAVWSLPAGARTSILLVEGTAVALVGLGLSRDPVTRSALLTALLLSCAGILHTEIAMGLEWWRRDSADMIYGDLSSVWTFGAAFLLPPTLATVVVGAIFLHQWWRGWRRMGVPAYRHLYTTATVVLAVHAAAAVLAYAGDAGPVPLAGPRALLAAALAVLAYTTVNTGLVAAAVALSAAGPRPSPVHLIGRWDDNALEIATLCLGALVAWAWTSDRWQVPLVVAPLLVLHRAMLARELEQVARTDSKTGLLNAAAWHTQAARELRRSLRTRSSAAVLMLDLDHFKAVNDEHGHLAGDDVLGAVADALRTEVREHDLVGRFGGEEFVVLLPDLGRTDEPGRSAEPGHAAELCAVAERIRLRIGSLSVPVSTPSGPAMVSGLTVSVGGAGYPECGADLGAVLEAADGALYAAKRDGRNVVRLAEPSMRPARPAGRR